MERVVRVRDDGRVKAYIGMEICSGPRTYRLLLTRPTHSEGQIIEIPMDDVESVEVVEPGPRGEPPVTTSA